MEDANNNLNNYGYLTASQYILHGVQCANVLVAIVCDAHVSSLRIHLEAWQLCSLGHLHCLLLVYLSLLLL
jgi:hypothetical protein